MAKTRIIYIHGNRTMHWSTAWTPWLRDELEIMGFDPVFETFPDSIDARSEYWLPYLHDHLKAGPDDVLLGWSSGAVAAMRYAESHRILGSVLVCPYVFLDDPLERRSGYFDGPWDWPAVRGNQESVAVFHGDRDPYIPRDQFDLVADELDATVFEIAGGGHFLNQIEFPELLEYFRMTFR
jgi:predicted alpha/beta hydrolase family esterase